MLTVLVAPTVEPVDLAEAKAHLRLVHSDDDALVGSLISAAREHVERHTGRALAAGEYRYAADDENAWSLPLWPATITAATYRNASGARVPLPAYTYDADRNEITLAGGGLAGDQINYEFTTAAPTALPAPLRAAILLLVGDLYENAEATAVGVSVAANPTLDRLLYPYRVNLGL